MKLNLHKALLVLLLALGLPAWAEDIDLFVSPANSTTDAPNVLIILDNTANWNTAFTNEMAALSSVVSGLDEDKFRVGLMMFTETGGGNSGNDGAYVRAAVRLMTSDAKTKYVNLVNSLHITDDKSNGGKIGKSMWEAYLYFSGGTPHAGNNKNKTDYIGNTSGSAASNAIYALTGTLDAATSLIVNGNALASKSATTYIDPIVSGCAKNFIIYISNGAAQDNNSDTTASSSALNAAYTAASMTRPSDLALSPSGSQNNVADEWARFLKASNLGITTYTIDINKVTTGQGPGWTALLQSMAKESGGDYFDVASSGNQIRDALNDIFSEIQSVNSVFASVSLPVSVNTQGTYLNQVFVGMFRPDEDSNPLWDGNLKQYKLGLDSNNSLRLKDADDANAINSNTGFISECRRSFWTPSTANSYWSFKGLEQTCMTVANSADSDYPDGNMVEKGAQSYVLRYTNPTTRTVETCSSTFSTCTTLVDFNTTNVTQSALGAADATEHTALVNWAQGKDVDDENGNSVTLGEMRPSAHGDVVHSRPVAINFGTIASPEVVVFYGGNDGTFRAVNGNRSDAIGSYAAGKEMWAFIPPEFHSSIKRLRDNTTKIKYPGQAATTPTPLAKNYGMDGPITAYKDTDDAWVYATMRRGGRVLYAFDVDVDDPTSISLKWKKGCPNNFPASGTVSDTDCTTGFSGIGQTWSSPKSLTASGYDSGNSPMLIMGGGYDPCEDTDNGTNNHSCTAATKGNVIYVLDADTGSLLKSFNTVRSVVGDVTVITNSTGQAEYAYASDMGGNVYRITIGTDAPVDWTITQIASLGCDTTAACSANRKFMFAPDVVQDDDTFYILLGSGDREKPLNDYTASGSVTNHFYMIKDVPSDAAWLSSESSNCTASLICLDSLVSITTNANPSETDLSAKKGWSLVLDSTEQVVTSAITVFGVVTFSTHQPVLPVSGVCSSLGESRVYNIEYANAASANGTTERYADLAGDGLPPSPVAGLVTLDDGSTVPFCIGCNADSPLEGGSPEMPPSANQPKARVYWNIEQ